MRVLVAIAHHGSKNRAFLLRMLDAFAEMSHDVHVVVVCEELKDLPSHVEQVVGLPASDPWSLPFAHRQVFADRVDDFDLLVYSEDDTLIEQRHLDTFVALQEVLPDDVITGFMRFELHPNDERSYCTVHSHYRWLPSSVEVFGDLTFARFTNDHSACYAVTQEQLRRAIRSGGFLVPPHAGRYDMLVSAATDVYTQCGMRKLLCLERIEDQLVHHMPNVYLGQLGISETLFRSHLAALTALAGDEHDGGGSNLFTPESRMAGASWDRHNYPDAPARLLESLAGPPSRILSIGATTGETEGELARLGHQVTALPLDAVFDASVRERGIASLPVALLTEDVAAGEYDHILLVDVLPYLPDPVGQLRALRGWLAPNGRLVATLPDHRRYRLRNSVLPQRRVPVPARFESDGVHTCDRRTVRNWMETAGLEITYLQHRKATRREPFGIGGGLDRLGGNTLLVVAKAAR